MTVKEHAERYLNYDDQDQDPDATPIIESLLAEVERLTAERDRYKADAETMRAAAKGVVAHMEGRQPISGWLRDNNLSRDALNALAEAVRG